MMDLMLAWSLTIIVATLAGLFLLVGCIIVFCEQGVGALIEGWREREGGESETKEEEIWT